MLEDEGTPKKPYRPPRLFYLTAADIVRKAIRVVIAQEQEKLLHPEPDPNTPAARGGAPD